MRLSSLTAILLAVMLLAVSAIGQDAEKPLPKISVEVETPKANAYASLAEARAAVGGTEKPIIAYFSADW